MASREVTRLSHLLNIISSFVLLVTNRTSECSKCYDHDCVKRPKIIQVSEQNVHFDQKKLILSKSYS